MFTGRGFRNIRFRAAWTRDDLRGSIREEAPPYFCVGLHRDVLYAFTCYSDSSSRICIYLAVDMTFAGAGFCHLNHRATRTVKNQPDDPFHSQGDQAIDQHRKHGGEFQDHASS